MQSHESDWGMYDMASYNIQDENKKETKMSIQDILVSVTK